MSMDVIVVFRMLFEANGTVCQFEVHWRFMCTLIGISNERDSET